MSRHPDPTHRILQEIDARPDVSQRTLASSLGIALGLTNSLIKGLVRRGWVKVARVQRHRVRYLLTPAGMAEKARLSQAAFHQAIDRYRTARAQVQQMFALVSESWDGDEAGRKPVIFYGSGELAEIGFICLQETDLTLRAVIDIAGRDRFFGVPVFARAEGAEALHLAGPDARVLVMTGVRTELLEIEVAGLGEPGQRAVWL